MQFTVDTRTATAFELNALAEFVQKLASVAPEKFAEGWTVQRAPSGAMLASGSAPLTFVPGGIELSQGNVPTIGSAVPAVGAKAQDAGPVPEVPAARGAIPPAPVAAPEFSSPTAAPAAPTEVPAAPALPAEAEVSGPKLDKAGCPWDARIHTSNMAVIGDGTWRKKPGVDPAYFEQVKAELMGAIPPAVPQAPAIEPAVPEAPGAAVAVPPAPTPDDSLPLTGQDVLSRCTEIQMAHPEKGAPLFQAIVSAGIVGGPMGLLAVTDVEQLKKALEAVNAVGAA